MLLGPVVCPWVVVEDERGSMIKIFTEENIE
jgi:hypothetical protein